MSHQTKHLYEFGHFRLDARERLLLREGESVPLTPKAFDLLLALVEHHGHLMEKDELLKLVWPDTIVEEANLSYHISLIRKVLGDRENSQKYIETVPKRGYRFVAEVREVGAEQEEVTEAATRRAIGGTRPGSLISKVKLHRKSAPLSLAVLVVAFGGVAFGLYKFTNRSESKNSGAEPRVIPLTSLPGQELQPAFSPDGNQIAFVWRNEKDGRSDIYIKMLDAETRLQITNNPDEEVTPVHHSSASGIFPISQINLADEVSPAWSPDSRFIVFDSRVKGSADIFVINAEGEQPRQPRALTSDPSDDVTPSWSADGRWIYFSSNRSGSMQIWKMHPEGVQAVQVTKRGGFLGRESLDGKFVYYLKDRGVPGIWRVPAEGGEEVLVLTRHNAGVTRA